MDTQNVLPTVKTERMCGQSLQEDLENSTKIHPLILQDLASIFRLQWEGQSILCHSQTQYISTKSVSWTFINKINGPCLAGK